MKKKIMFTIQIDKYQEQYLFLKCLNLHNKLLYKTTCFAPKEMHEGSERCVRITKFEYFAVQIHGKLQTTVAGITVHTSYLDDSESQSITQNNFYPFLL